MKWNTTQPQEWETTTHMDECHKWRIKQVRHKREHTVWSILYEVEKQAKLTCNFSSQNIGHPWKESQ